MMRLSCSPLLRTGSNSLAISIPTTSRMSCSSLAHDDNHSQGTTGYNQIAAPHVSDQVGALPRYGSAQEFGPF